MRRRLAVTIVAAATALTGAVVAPALSYPRPGSFQNVSVTPTGTAGNADSGWGASGPDHNGLGVAMTPDGRFVAFASAASDLTPGDSNGLSDIFVRDRKTGRTSIASIPTAGSLGGGAGAVALAGCTGSAHPAISANGRYVAFDSCAINLLGPGKDTNFTDDVFVHDMTTGVTTRVSVASNGAESLPFQRSVVPAMSADGRYVAFESSATNFGPVCPDLVDTATCTAAATLRGLTQVFVHDMRTGSTRLVSATTSGQVADGASFDAAISPDGRDIAFVTFADNLVTNDHNVSLSNTLATPSAPDVYIRDQKTGAVRLVSVALTGQSPNGGLFPESGARVGDGVGRLALSANDRYVAFGSSATDVVPAGTGGGIFVRDLVLNRTQRVSVSSDGRSWNDLEASGGCGVSHDTGISRDGRFVTFSCQPDPTCPDPYPYVSVYDRLTGALDRVTMEDSAPGSPNLCSSNPGSWSDMKPAISGDGRLVAFASDNPHLIKGTRGSAYNVIVRDRGPAQGVGVLSSARGLPLAPARSDRPMVVRASDSSADVSDLWSRQGADLIGASVAYRPAARDLFVRLQVAHLPALPVVNSALVYGLNLSVSGRVFQIRARSTAVGASFELFRLTAPGGWQPVGNLDGGYGTTGQEVAVTLPLSALGGTPGVLRDVTAFTAVAGPSLGGAVNALDTLPLMGG